METSDILTLVGLIITPLGFLSFLHYHHNKWFASNSKWFQLFVFIVCACVFSFHLGSELKFSDLKELLWNSCRPQDWPSANHVYWIIGSIITFIAFEIYMVIVKTMPTKVQ